MLQKVNMARMLFVSKRYHCLAVLGTFLLLFKPGMSQSDSVSQSPDRLEIREGRPAFLSCNFSTLRSDPYLLWYRQYVEREPQLILQAYKTRQTNRFSQEKISATLFIENSTLPLKIDAASLQDRAVYYCALRPTVGHSSLLIRTKTDTDLMKSEPSVYRLNLLQEKGENLSACLITDYFPDNITVGLNDNLETVNSTILLMENGDSSTASYGTVLWGKDQGDFSCRASYEGKNYETDHMEDAEDVCLAEEFETDERLNFLSLTVLGFRIIFLKSVATSLFLTFRLWSC